MYNNDWSHSMNLKINDLQLAAKYRYVLDAVITRFAQYEDCDVEVSPSKRGTNGFLQWMAVVMWWGSNKPLTIGIVQRSEESHVEFHS